MGSIAEKGSKRGTARTASGSEKGSEQGTGINARTASGSEKGSRSCRIYSGFNLLIFNCHTVTCKLFM